MEVLGVFLFAAVIGGLFWFFVVRDKDDEPAKGDGAGKTPGFSQEPNEISPEPGPRIQDSPDFSTENLEKLTKVELEELGKQHGVRLKRGQNKSAMISTLRDGVRTQLK